MLGWKKHKLESRLPGEISITSDMQVTIPLCQKMKIMSSGPIMGIDGETVETVADFIFWGSKITADGDCSAAMKLKNAYSLKGKL